jgi:hypothetical protein
MKEEKESGKMNKGIEKKSNESIEEYEHRIRDRGNIEAGRDE